jgi:hypothetical protein
MRWQAVAVPGLGTFRVATRPPGARAAPSGENLVPCFNFHVRFQGQRQQANQQAHAAEGACVRAPWDASARLALTSQQAVPCMRACSLRTVRYVTAFRALSAPPHGCYRGERLKQASPSCRSVAKRPSAAAKSPYRLAQSSQGPRPGDPAGARGGGALWQGRRSRCGTSISRRRARCPCSS